jgi:CMP-N-acetylneuraminic acid synthetase
MIKPRVLAVIPARKGSERLPQKNIKNFCGKPLIEWTIEAALNSEWITKTVVSSDDEAVLGMKDRFNRADFIKRPAELATNISTSVDVVLHAMNLQPAAFDYVILLQPTSPLRNFRHINQAIEDCINSNAGSLVSVRKSQDNLNFVLVKDPQSTFYLSEKIKAENCWVLNGAIYIAGWKSFLTDKKFVVNSTGIFEMDFESSIDIDTAEDLARAEAIMAGKIK